MSRRSAINPRYQKHGTPAGKTRKSAAAAKPKRSSGAPAPKSNAKKEVSAERKKAAQGAYRAPGTAEFAKWRRIWYIVFGTAVGLLTVSLVTSYWLKAERVAQSLSWASLVFLAVAFYLDSKKIRPIRNAAYDAAVLGHTLEDPPAEKPDAAARGAKASEDPETSEPDGES